MITAEAKKQLIDGVAQSVAAQGALVETQLRSSRAREPQFAFLYPGGVDHEYYTRVLAAAHAEAAARASHDARTTPMIPRAGWTTPTPTPTPRARARRTTKPSRRPRRVSLWARPATALEEG